MSDSNIETWQCLNTKGNKLFGEQKIDEALVMYDKAILLSKEQEPKLFNNRANARLQLGRFADALDDCNKALTLLSFPLSGYADEDPEANDVTAAVSAIGSAQQLLLVKALVRKALALIGLGVPDKPLLLLKSALQLDPENENVSSLINDLPRLTPTRANKSVTDVLDPALERLHTIPKGASIPVTVISGFLGAGKSTLLNRILTNRAGLKVALIVNDMAGINVDALAVEAGVGAAALSTEEKLVEFSNGCICCTLRGDLLDAVSKLVAEQRFNHIIIESTGISEPMPVAATFAMKNAAGDSLNDWARIDTMVTVVDASTVLESFGGTNELTTLASRGWGAQPDDKRCVVDLLVEQIEFSNVIVMNKCDLLADAAEARCAAALTALNPRAVLKRAVQCDVAYTDVMGTCLFNLEDASKAAGWVKELEGGHEHLPETQEYGIGSFSLTAVLPFHPLRLWNLLQSEAFLPRTLRSKGFVWLAGGHESNDVMWQWSAAGQSLQFGRGAAWACASAGISGGPHAPHAPHAWPKDWHPIYGDRQNRVVVIFFEAQKEKLKASLEAALLTSQEFAGGIEAWKLFENPFHQLKALERGRNGDSKSGEERQSDEHGRLHSHQHPHKS